MILLSLHQVELAFGSEPLLGAVDLELAERERVALVGRNGAGKSTLLKLLAGDLEADSGRLEVAPGVRVSGLPQDVPAGIEGPIEAIVSSALVNADDGESVSGGNDPIDWDPNRLVAQTLSRLGLEPLDRFETLSGGQKRRVLLARALVGHPGVLLLDEPTNHLDLPTIGWLQHLLQGYRGAVIFTTHDRRFLSELATRIIEVDRGGLTSWPGDYNNFLRRRDERLAAEERANGRFDKRLAEEEVWIRQGIKARRTRNEGRVRRLESMRKERSVRRERAGNVRLQNQSAGESGRRVIEARDITLSYGGAPLVAGFSTLIGRGDRVGLLGPNGAGKTTLLRALLGEFEPESGEVIAGTRLQLAYADQHRALLDEDAAVQDWVAQGTDHIEFNGESRHVIGYLRDFLFTADQARGPVSNLSGGERNRLLLARLFAQPANLLVMDEPTNDLDVETLELLEALLVEYTGTLLVVSHDREFLDNVVTSILAFEAPGKVNEYVGGFNDWLRQSKVASESGLGGQPKASRKTNQSGGRTAPRATKKLSFKETRELQGLPARIEMLEERLQTLQAELADPALYKEGADAVLQKKADLQVTSDELESAFERWTALEAKSQS